MALDHIAGHQSAMVAFHALADVVEAAVAWVGTAMLVPWAHQILEAADWMELWLSLVLVGTIYPFWPGFVASFDIKHKPIYSEERNPGIYPEDLNLHRANQWTLSGHP